MYPTLVTLGVPNVVPNLLSPFRPALLTDGSFSLDQSVWVHTDAVQAIGHMSSICMNDLECHIPNAAYECRC